MAGNPVSQASKDMGLRMKNILKELGVTQETAAFKLGLAYQSSLNHYLAGRSEIPIDIVQKFSKIFNASLSTLMGEEEYRALDFTDPDVLIIIAAVDKYCAENKTQMSAEGKAEVLAHFFKQKEKSIEAIYAALSLLHRKNSELFVKDKTNNGAKK